MTSGLLPVQLLLLLLLLLMMLLLLVSGTNTTSTTKNTMPTLHCPLTLSCHKASLSLPALVPFPAAGAPGSQPAHGWFQAANG